MTNKEVKKYWLNESVGESNNSIGYKDDEIFLLSTDEYNRYKNIIPEINDWWWLRSPGDSGSYAAFVDIDGAAFSYGSLVFFNDVCVRPTLKISNLESENLKIGESFVLYNNQWIYLGDNIAISKNPIGQHEFDNEINDYETSEIRKYLLDWLEVRK